jgi:hypothetical protein
VLFAVIPSYFESFCYSAHELYEAGIPLIVSNIPSFENYFRHEENALVFDGTVSDLNNQMIRLVTDGLLRKKITRPYSLIQNPLGDIYTHQKVTSWITSQEVHELPSLLVCVLCDHLNNLDVTLQSLKTINTMSVKQVFAYPVEKDSSDETLAWFLGKSYSFKNEHGESLHPTQVFTEEALLILKAGDTLEPSYITTGLQTLRSQSQISFVGGWKKKKTGGKR